MSGRGTQQYSPAACHVSNDAIDIFARSWIQLTVRPVYFQVLPFLQFYRGAEGRVAAFSASVAKVQRLRDALSIYSTPRCSLGASPIISELSRFRLGGVCIYTARTWSAGTMHHGLHCLSLTRSCHPMRGALHHALTAYCVCCRGVARSGAAWPSCAGAYRAGCASVIAAQSCTSAEARRPSLWEDACDLGQCSHPCRESVSFL